VGEAERVEAADQEADQGVVVIPAQVGGKATQEWGGSKAVATAKGAGVTVVVKAEATVAEDAMGKEPEEILEGASGNREGDNLEEARPEHSLGPRASSIPSIST